jgi:anti-sigma B factor antagonist
MSGETETGLGGRPVADVTRVGGAVVVRLAGELDLHNAPEVRDALLDVAGEGPERIVVDLTEVDFADSTVLGVLVETRGRLLNTRALVLVSPALEIRRALETSGLDRHLPVHDSVEAALAAAL